MSCYRKPNSHIRNKIKVGLACQIMLLKTLEHATDFDTSTWTLKRFSCFKRWGLLTSLSKSKAKVDVLDVGRLKTVPVDFKKLSDVVD